MSHHQRYQHLLEELDLTQVGAAKFLGVDERTGRRWASDERPVPQAVSMLLETMVAEGISVERVKEIVRKANKKARPKPG